MDMTGGRAGTRRSAKRRVILRATQTVILPQGCAAVTFERVYRSSTAYGAAVLR